jgi:threonine dehydrogenase-like Zn-dependent dehydrogenase
MEKVLAAVVVAAGQTELAEFEMPGIVPEAGLLKLEAAGVCGSDWPSYLQKAQQPRILGHENVGVIAKVGKIAAQRWGVKEGDRVALEEYLPCGHCNVCRTGDFRLCDFTDPWMGGIRYGATPVSVPPSLWGGYSQYQFLHPNSVLHKVASHVPATEAALALPLGNGIEWVCREGGAGIGTTVVIQGPGQQGLGCVLAAKEAGAACIIVSGLSTDANRLELACELGAHHAINIERENLSEQVAEITANRMADVVIDTSSGGPSTILSALALVKKRGTVILAGKKQQPVPEFHSDNLITRYVTLKGVRGHSYASVELALQIIASGKYPLGKMCTHQYSLGEVDQALRTVGGMSGTHSIHVTVLPWWRQETAAGMDR